MKIKLIPLFMALLFLVVSCFNFACSKEEPSLMDKVKKADETMDKKYPGKSTDDPLYEKHIAIAEQCSEKYEACLEKCAKAASNDKNDNCDSKCQEELTLCEKALPDDLKSFK